MARKTWTEDGRTNRSGDGSSTRRIKKITIEYEDIDYESDRKKSSRDDPYAKFVKRYDDMGKKIWGGSGLKKSSRGESFIDCQKRQDKELNEFFFGTGSKKSPRGESFIDYQKRQDKELNEFFGGFGSKKSSRGGVSSTNPKKGSTSSKSNRWRI